MLGSNQKKKVRGKVGLGLSFEGLKAKPRHVRHLERAGENYTRTVIQYHSLCYPYPFSPPFLNLVTGVLHAPSYSHFFFFWGKIIKPLFFLID